MKKIKIPYGDKELAFPIDDTFEFNIMLPKEEEISTSQQVEIINTSINNYFSDNRVNIFKRSKTVGIAVNDVTRPLPNELLLPPLLRFITKNNIDPREITFFIASGTHKSPGNEEINNLLTNKIRNRYRTIVHNCDEIKNLMDFGESAAGTPIYVNKKFIDNDIKIVVGQIEPHHFMGFSGGVKCAVIGLGGRKTIEMNHKMITDPYAKMGIFYENPMRRDIEEIGKKLKIDIALNVVLNSKKEVVFSSMGDPFKVMVAGIKKSRDACLVEDSMNYDLVIASAGGYPKDINFYQAQKAITHGCTFLDEKGVLILAAECREGLGSQKLRAFLEGKQSIDDIIKAFKGQKFQIGPHKAYQLALQLKKHRIILVSRLDPIEARKLFLIPANDMQDALWIAKKMFTYKPRVAILPYATHLMGATN